MMLSPRLTSQLSQPWPAWYIVHDEPTYSILVVEIIHISTQERGASHTDDLSLLQIFFYYGAVRPLWAVLS
jgi:hypothetical protein